MQHIHRRIPYRLSLRPPIRSDRLPQETTTVARNDQSDSVRRIMRLRYSRLNTTRRRLRSVTVGVKYSTHHQRKPNMPTKTPMLVESTRPLTWALRRSQRPPLPVALHRQSSSTMSNQHHRQHRRPCRKLHRSPQQHRPHLRDHHRRPRRPQLHRSPSSPRRRSVSETLRGGGP